MLMLASDNQKIGSMGRIHLSLAVAVLCGGAAAIAEAAPIVGKTGAGRAVPPTKYLTAKEKADVIAGRKPNPNPPLDLDLNGDRINDAWDIPMSFSPLIRKFGEPPMTLSTTDENMPNPGRIFMVGIPDPNGFGFGSDHYSPRYARQNDATRAGVELGACVYTLGRNSWHLEFEDANNNKKPDKFLKSIWLSENGDPAGPQANERTYFVTDLTKEKVAAEKVIRKPGDPGVGTLSYSITDMAIFPLGADPASVMLGGDPIGLPGPSPDDDETEDIRQVFDDQSPLETNQLIGPDDPLMPGQTYSVAGVIENTDDVSHEFTLALFGLNATLLGAPGTMLIGPGQFSPYQLQFTVLGPGPVGISSLAYSETGAASDGWLDAVVMQAVPEPAALMLAYQALVLAAYAILGKKRGRELNS